MHALETWNGSMLTEIQRSGRWEPVSQQRPFPVQATDNAPEWWNWPRLTEIQKYGNREQICHLGTFPLQAVDKAPDG
jgi:hypothetical protein